MRAPVSGFVAASDRPPKLGLNPQLRCFRYVGCAPPRLQPLTTSPSWTRATPCGNGGVSSHAPGTPSPNLWPRPRTSTWSRDITRLLRGRSPLCVGCARRIPALRPALRRPGAQENGPPPPWCASGGRALPSVHGFVGRLHVGGGAPVGGFQAQREVPRVALVRGGGPRQPMIGVRRGKARFPCGCESRPATAVPAGSSQSGLWR